MDRFRRALSYQVSVGALVEVALWLAIPYLCISFVWVFAHDEQVARIEPRLAKVMPAGADFAAFGVMAVLWPASLQIAEACPVR